MIIAIAICAGIVFLIAAGFVTFLIYRRFRKDLPKQSKTIGENEIVRSLPMESPEKEDNNGVADASE